MKIAKFSLFLLCVLIAFSVTSQAQTEDLDYSSGSQGEDGPFVFPAPLNIRIQDAALAGDTDRNEVVVFGGYDSSGNLSSATWVWTKENGWEEKFPTATPPARSNALMCYDSDRKEIILYGGWSQNGQLNDTWVWNGEDWQQKAQENPPTINYWNSAMVYDAARKTAVIISSQNYGYGGVSMYFWDGASWTQQSITLPSNYYYNFSVAYDAKNEKIVLLTQDGATLLYDGVSWVSSGANTKPFNNSYWDSRNKLAWDPVGQKVLFFGGAGSGSNSNYGNDTWAWDGSQWEEVAPDRSPSPRYSHAIAGLKDGVLLLGGWGDYSWEYYSNNPSFSGSTEFWDGENWNYSSGGVYEVDMNEKDDGIWRYTSITIPKGMVVRFNKNERNSSVQWLASGHVEIDGIVDVSGEKGENFYSYSYYYGSNAPSNPIGIISKGGPGGFDGGRGGVRFQNSGSYAGMPGVGPGGGAPGINNTASQDSYGKPGGFTGSADSSGAIISTYGNTYLQPLVGGSGGGGSASFDAVDGVSGGGGGGAILIASTRDITINGKIMANGGDSGQVYYYNYNNYYYYNQYNYYNYYKYSGSGSGGAIRLVADRVLGKGSLRSGGGSNNYSNIQSIATTGRIRVEAYERDLANSPSNFPPPFQAPPIKTSPIKDHGKLRVASVHGENVAEPASGDMETPDVVFDAAGIVKIIVAAENVPDGTRIKVRITTKGDAVVSEPVSLTNGQAEFNLSVPAGEGTIQAYSLRSLTYKDEAEENGQPQS